MTELWSNVLRGALVGSLASLITTFACGANLSEVKRAQRTSNARGHELAAFVIRVCEDGYNRAETETEIDALDRIGCVQALRSLTALSEADSDLASAVDTLRKNGAK